MHINSDPNIIIIIRYVLLMIDDHCSNASEVAINR